jgi:hypothetical protein
VLAAVVKAPSARARAPGCATTCRR